jgi:DNA-binding MarR family transcriptional regulator
VAVQLRQSLLLLERLHKDLARVLERVLAPEKLALAEWLIVSELASGAAPLTRIARRPARDPGSLSRATTRLIKRGLLGSARHERDRRCATLDLTAEGLLLHERIVAAIAGVAGLHTLPSAERLRALAGLQGCGPADTPAPAAAHPPHQDPHGMTPMPLPPENDP